MTDTPPIDPLTLLPYDAAVWHLTRAASIMAAVAVQAEHDGGMPASPASGLLWFEGVFRQAEIHAAIGAGYAALTALTAATPGPAPVTPPIVYPNG